MQNPRSPRAPVALVSALAAIGLATSGFGQGHGGSRDDDVRVDPELPVYESADGVAGVIKSIGSDTMNNLMALWAEGFVKAYPNVQVEIEGKGSSTAPPALTEGTANFGPMSRPMKDKEIEFFAKAHGYAPTAIPTSIDMLVVYVNKDNPIESLTLEQVDAIFSANRTGGYREDITTWGQLGLTGEWMFQRIELYGRNSASGTYGFFKDKALFGGDFKNSVKEQPGSSAVVQAVAEERFAIGYSGIGYRTADVRAVPIAADGGDPVDPTPETVRTYPLWRFLYTYVNYEPGKPLDPLRREFLKFVYSRRGQEIVLKDGYLPVPATVARNALRTVNETLATPSAD
ncbi:MAG: PstS family phosphate ABC transporter substrate-binding protein [Planctomycetota bacterium]|jgi:phosphate transport system substrate-binding protein